MMNVAIFGLGFVGKELARHLATHFVVDTYSANTQIAKSIIFDANNTEDIKKLTGKKYDFSIVTFPLDSVSSDFVSMLFQISHRNILLGSTGIYKRHFLGEVITEYSEVDEHNKRYLSESQFLSLGGTLLRLAGIYGKERNPLRWLSSPRVGYSEKQLNLIHVDDICQIIFLMLKHKTQKNMYNLSDGKYHSWKEIIDFAYTNKLIATIPQQIEPQENSFIENKAIYQDYPDVCFTNLFDYLRCSKAL